MNYDAKQHSYEEIREAIIEIITRSRNVPEQWASLVRELELELARRDGASAPQTSLYGSQTMHPYDAELARDAFWDLFRQGMITLGINDSNPAWPWFRLSHLGKTELLQQNPLRFHDAGTFIALVKRLVPDISEAAIRYLQEAAGAFYADLMLSSCVMIGVAAEAEFIRLVDVAAAHPIHGSRFNSAQKADFIGTKVMKFRQAIDAIRADFPKPLMDNVEILMTIQAIIRTARNEAGHPVATNVIRQQVYVYLQLFAEMARQMMLFRQALS
ncbi:MULTISPECIES: hypothetical protein [Rhizobium]|uniref:hypothetical protein n=1 Tax=Rhizobium TaxID=379 RepID=UPI0010304B8A|nr:MULTISPECIES: hypothetical protein [Rhizobium]TAZ29823.1 hypothetical protein ELH73_08120 [Rhizobium leguminosarum]TBC57152.1 hypothetical protein ELH32_08555 [Rhizobium ruizarguesonis]